MATESLFKQTLYRIGGWIVRHTGWTPGFSPLIEQAEDNTSKVPIFDLDSRVVDESSVVRSDGSTGPQLHAARYDHALARVGWTDGRLGIDPVAQSELIRAQAALTLQMRIAPVRVEYENTKAAENTRKKEHVQAESDWQAAKDEHGKVLAQQRRDPAEYSWRLGWVYVVFGAFALLADIPLSLLVAEGLGVQLAIPRGNPHDLLNLIRHWNVAWEAGLVALGIAALTVVFKLAIDRLHIRDDDVEPAVQRRRSVIRTTILLAVVIATIFACVVMGQVRAAGGSPTSRQLQSLFIALALLFPLAAAYCFSMARVCSQNAQRLRLAAKQLKSAWKRHKVALAPYETAQALRSAAEERFNAMNSSEVDEMFLRELYAHSYERGWAVPETRHASASLYVRCERLMHRTLARIEQFDNAS